MKPSTPVYMAFEQEESEVPSSSPISISSSSSYNSYDSYGFF